MPTKPLSVCGNPRRSGQSVRRDWQSRTDHKYYANDNHTEKDRGPSVFLAGFRAGGILHPSTIRQRSCDGGLRWWLVDISLGTAGEFSRPGRLDAIGHVFGHRDVDWSSRGRGTRAGWRASPLKDMPNKTLQRTPLRGATEL